MPIHDWTRACDAAYHSFQLDWAVRLSARLNGSILPPSHFAMTETLELRPAADFCALREPDGPVSHRNGFEDLPSATETPPPTRFRAVDERVQYACRIVTVRDELRQPVSAVVFVTRQDKETPYRLEALVRIAVGALARGIHLLLVDLFPPGKRDPQGVHPLIWERLRDESFALPADKLLTLAAYSAGQTVIAYVEPVTIGDALPSMPIFLTEEAYVLAPLEATYAQTWAVYPAFLKEMIEPPAE